MATVMDPIELLLRGMAALLVMGVLIAVARVRFRAERDSGTTTDIGLD